MATSIDLLPSVLPGLAMQRLLIILGAVLLVAGACWPWLSKFPFGRLPGDITIEREIFSFHVPLATSILLSLLLTLTFWLWHRALRHQSAFSPTGIR